MNLPDGSPDAAPGRRPRRRLLLPLLLALAGVVVALVVAELAPRVISETSDTFWQPDAVLGHAHIPGKKGVWRSACYSVPVSITSWGFRGGEWSREKPPGTSHVVVLGDSLVEGFQVPFDETLTTRLERKLNAAGTGLRYETLNLGVGSYGTGQNYLNLVHRGFPFQPDVVLLGFSISTDVMEDSQVLDGHRDRPFIRVEPGGLRVVRFPYPPPFRAFKDSVRGLHLYGLII